MPDLKVRHIDIAKDSGVIEGIARYINLSNYQS